MASKLNRQVSNDEWEQMKSMISEQLDHVTSNLEELRENGSLEAIDQVSKCTPADTLVIALSEVKWPEEAHPQKSIGSTLDYTPR